MAQNSSGLCQKVKYCNYVADCPRVRKEIKRQLEHEGRLPRLSYIEREIFKQRFKKDGCPLGN